MTKTINIKKYTNRKLYLSGMGYITLKEVRAMILDGNTIKVLCNETRRDITSDTLSQALIDLQLPVNTLRGLIYTHASLTDTI